MKLIITLLLGLSLLCAGCQPKSTASVEHQLDQVFREAHEAGKFDGNVLIVRDGKTLYKQSFGRADRRTGTANAPETRFPIASVSKPFTAILVLQLFEQGNLKFTDRLDGIFPNLVGKAVAGVTVEQLLTHTSGIEEIIERYPKTPLTAIDLESARLTGKPGEYRYSSSGYVILKMIAERTTATDYETLLRDRIFQPAGMTASGLLRDGVIVPQIALAYENDKSADPISSLIDTATPIATLDGAGSIYSTTGDLQRFDEALSVNRLLSVQSQALMYKRHTSSPGTPWGYGWAAAEQGGKVFPYHSGDYMGYHTVLVRQIHRKELIAILSNLGTADVSALRQKALKILKTA